MLPAGEQLDFFQEMSRGARFKLSWTANQILHWPARPAGVILLHAKGVHELLSGMECHYL